MKKGTKRVGTRRRRAGRARLTKESSEKSREGRILDQEKLGGKRRLEKDLLMGGEEKGKTGKILGGVFSGGAKFVKKK